MKRRRWLYLLAMIFGIICTSQAVLADVSSGPNTGKLVYQDKEYITNGQYDKLVKINQGLNVGPHPQSINLIIKKQFDEYGNDDIMLNTSFNFLNKNRSLWLGDSEGHSASFSKRWGSGSNFLIVDLQNNLLWFYPSGQAASFLTDYGYKVYRSGYNFKIEHSNASRKIDVALDVADEMTPELKKVARSKKRLHNLSFEDLFEFFRKYLMILIFLTQIIVAIIYTMTKKKGRGPYQPEINDSYDAGFNEGYYYGRNDPSN
ncbi:hypothetical protein [Companilactobacillus sp. HBUAS56257]|uniref:hypothetical protein n=1 Tax=Companilactobacillus sp. HBUAS56257 TaxID=3109360 RepID=UPI002FF28F78